MFVLLALLLSCDTQPTARQSEEMTVDRQQEIYSKASPIPMFDFSLERERVIQLYQARMDAVQTWSVWRSNTGMIEGDCPSSGYPIPYGTQLSSPEVSNYYGSQAGGIALPQAEPNGLFTNGVTTNATWVFCVVDGAIVPAYVEGLVTAYAMPMNVDYTTNRVTPIAGATPTVTIKR